MPFQYSCFISYRHTTEYKGRSYTERIVEDLKAELEFRVTQQVYRDVERLKGAEFYQESLATALCQSICMVVLYWPTYFSQEYTFCAREFKAMEDLEAQRLQLLDDEAEKQNSLIIILAIRGFELIPHAIKARRLCKNFEAYTMKPDMRADPAFQQDMFDISKYIADRVRVFQLLNDDPFSGCTSFRLPPAQNIEPWIRQVIHSGTPLRTRELPR